MHFSKALRRAMNPQFRQAYIKYKELKRLLKRALFEMQEGSSLEETKFYASLHDNLKEVNTFFSDKTHECVLEQQKMKNFAEKRRKLSKDDDTARLLSAPMSQNNRGSTSSLMSAGNSTGSIAGAAKRPSFGGNSTSDASKKILELYLAAQALEEFRGINCEGFRKIVKKLDKKAQLEDPYQDEFMDYVRTQRIGDESATVALTKSLKALYADVAGETIEQGLERREAINQRRTMLAQFVYNVIIFLMACVLLTLAVRLGQRLVAIVLDTEAEELHRYLKHVGGMLVVVAMLWWSEGIPFFATLLSVPLLVVGLRFWHSDSQQAMAVAFGRVIQHALAALIGGCLLAALDNQGWEDRAVSWGWKQLWRRPIWMLRAGCLVGTALTCTMLFVAVPGKWLPIAFSGLVLPIARRIHPETGHIQGILIGIGVVCNLYDIITPSPLSAPLMTLLVVVDYVLPNDDRDFCQWLTVSFLCFSFFVGMELDYQMRTATQPPDPQPTSMKQPTAPKNSAPMSSRNSSQRLDKS